MARSAYGVQEAGPLEGYATVPMWDLVACGLEVRKGVQPSKAPLWMVPWYIALASQTKERNPHFPGFVITVQVVHPRGLCNKPHPFKIAHPLILADGMNRVVKGALGHEAPKVAHSAPPCG